MAATKILVVAIDFGSSGAGYAFSFAYQYKNNPLDVSTSLWNNGNGPLQSKVPAVLLFDPNKKFHSFGFEAEDKYEELLNADKAKVWYFLKGFKMQLYSAVNAGEVSIDKYFFVCHCFGSIISTLFYRGSSLHCYNINDTNITAPDEHLTTFKI